MERQVALFHPRKDGSTLYQNCRQVEKQLGYWPEIYAPIEPPEDYGFVWQIFWELREHCKSGFSGPESLGFFELDAWQRVRGFRLGNHVVDLIMAMDAAYMSEWRRQDKKNG